MAAVEFSDLDFLALFLGMLMSVMLGFVWYLPSLPTGKIWMRELGFTEEDLKPDGKQMAISMTLMVVGSFFMMFVFMHTMVAYGNAGQSMTIGGGLMAGFMVWLGFIVPVLWSRVAWEKGTWPLFGVQSGYYLIQLSIAGMIFSAML